jgi:mono/diheme cytochrome c family protein
MVHSRRAHLAVAGGVLLLGALGACAGAGAAAPSDALRFERGGAIVRSLSRAALRTTCRETEVEVDDPYHLKRKRYLACPLREVMVAGFGDEVLQQTDANFFLRARDGYTKPADGALLLEPGGFLAFADLSNPAGAGWEPIDRRRVDPGPFYVVWTEPGQNDVHTHPWPYQLAAIDLAPFEREFPHTLPEGLPPQAAAWTGFEVFRRECVACHAINGEGGRVGPDLNVPRSIAEYRPADQIKAFIRDPESFRYTSMPSHRHLSEAQLDGLVAYFEAMKARKHDPGSDGR